MALRAWDLVKAANLIPGMLSKFVQAYLLGFDGIDASCSFGNAVMCKLKLCLAHALFIMPSRYNCCRLKIHTAFAD